MYFKTKNARKYKSQSLFHYTTRLVFETNSLEQHTNLLLVVLRERTLFHVYSLLFQVLDSNPYIKERHLVEDMIENGENQDILGSSPPKGYIHTILLTVSIQSVYECLYSNRNRLLQITRLNVFFFLTKSLSTLSLSSFVFASTCSSLVNHMELEFS